MKEAFLKNFAIFTEKHTPVSESRFNKVADHQARVAAFLKTPAQVFSCEYCKFF